MKMPAKQCCDKFEEIVGGLMGGESTEAPAVLRKHSNNRQPPIEQPPFEQPPDEQPANAAMMRGVPTDEDLKMGYKGFIFAVCEHCGKKRGFCTKYETTTYKCDECGEYSDLENLKRMYVNCECGKSYKYMTNATEEMFDFPCLECTMPVPIKYNRKKDVYETMR
jgi:hypothetical protein